VQAERSASLAGPVSQAVQAACMPGAQRQGWRRLSLVL